MILILYAEKDEWKRGAIIKKRNKFALELTV